MPGTDDARLLEDRTRRLHRTLIETVLKTGRVPALSALADQLGMSQEAVQDGLQDLAAADYLALNPDGHVTCLYPFSVTPTPHVAIINSVRRFAMCSIDALGMPAMLDLELDLEGRCAACDAPIALRVRSGAVVTASPPTTLVVARRDEDEPAFATCCPFTVFVCSQDHAEQVIRRIPGASTLPLPDALRHAEAIFGSLLAETIPAMRPRGKGWGVSQNV